MTEKPAASAPHAPSSKRLEPLRQVDAGVLNIAYYEAGPADGPAVMLMHGFPYDIHSYVDVAPQLAAQGCRVIVPYLRGYGPTRFRDSATPRSGEQAAVGADMMALMDALGIKRAVFAGYDWGGRAACVGAALWPERCIGLVCVNSYLIQDIANAMAPQRAEREVALWYQYYFQLERGRAGLAANRREIAKILWTQWSPNWPFDDACFERTAIAHDNPDYVDVVIHSYRHRFGLADGDPQYAEIQRRLAALPSDHRSGDHTGRRGRWRRAGHRWHPQRVEIHRPPRSPRRAARRAQSAAGSARGVCRGGDGADQGVADVRFRRPRSPSAARRGLVGRRRQGLCPGSGASTPVVAADGAVEARRRRRSRHRLL